MTRRRSVALRTCPARLVCLYNPFGVSSSRTCTSSVPALEFASIRRFQAQIESLAELPNNKPSDALAGGRECPCIFSGARSQHVLKYLARCRCCLSVHMMARTIIPDTALEVRAVDSSTIQLLKRSARLLARPAWIITCDSHERTVVCLHRSHADEPVLRTSGCAALSVHQNNSFGRLDDDLKCSDVELDLDWN